MHIKDSYIKIGKAWLTPLLTVKLISRDQFKSMLKQAIEGLFDEDTQTGVDKNFNIPANALILKERMEQVATKEGIVDVGALPSQVQEHQMHALKTQVCAEVRRLRRHASGKTPQMMDVDADNPPPPTVKTPIEEDMPHPPVPQPPSTMQLLHNFQREPLEAWQWQYPSKEESNEPFTPYHSLEEPTWRLPIHVWRLRRLLDICSDEQNHSAWLQRFQRRTLEAELVTSHAGQAALSWHRTWIRLPPSKCRWTDRSQGQFVASPDMIHALHVLMHWDLSLSMGSSSHRLQPIVWALADETEADPCYQLTADARNLPERPQPLESPFVAPGRHRPDQAKDPRRVVRPLPPGRGPPSPQPSRVTERLICPYFERPVEVNHLSGHGLQLPAGLDCIYSPIVTIAQHGPETALLDLSQTISPLTTYLHVVVVPEDELADYVGHEPHTPICFLALPSRLLLDRLPSVDADGCPGGPTHVRHHWGSVATAEAGGLGYARLAVQLLAHWLEWPRLWFLDDGVHSVYTSMPLQACSTAPAEPDKTYLSLVLKHVERQFLPGTLWVKACPLTLLTAPEGSRLPPSGFVKDHCGDARYAVVGFTPYEEEYQARVQTPFTACPVARAFLLSVQHTVPRGLLVPPKPFGADSDFQHMCVEDGLRVLRYNTYFYRALPLGPRAAPQPQPRTRTWTSPDGPDRKRIRLSPPPEP